MRQRIENLELVKSIVRLTKEYSLPGFGGVPIYNVVRFIYEELQEDTITMRANAAAYNFFLSLFPAIIFIFTLLPLFPFSANFQVTLENAIKEFLPVSAHAYLFEVVNGILGIKREGLLSIGFFLALIFSTGGMLTLMDGFDKSYESTFKKRSWLRKRLVAMAMTCLLVGLMIVSILLIILSGQILGSLFNYFEINQYAGYAILFFRWVFVLLMFYSVITTIYRYGPSMKRRITLFNPGATLATLLSIVSSLLFAYFVNNFGRYNEIYGSIGALIALLIWIQINAFILIAGYELNASIEVNKDILKSD